MQELLPPNPASRPYSNSDSFSYIPAVDGLRGIAILLVLWYHAPFLFRDLPEFSAQQLPWATLGLLGSMSLGGWIGVDLFFVISGFLITSILIRLQKGSGSLWTFWGRRGLRILPLATLYLLALFVIQRLGDPLKMLPDFEGWAWYAFYLGNIHIAMYGWQPLAVMILWSLAIEEQFYLVWPVFIRMWRMHQVLWWSGGLMVMAPLIRAFTLSVADYPATYVFTFCRLDALAAGAVVAVLFGSRAWKEQAADLCKRLAPLASILIIITFLVPFSPSFPLTRPWLFSVFGYSWLAVSFAVLLGASLDIRGPIRVVLTSAPLTFLGRRCYGLYLWHVLVAGFVTACTHSLQVGFLVHVLLWLAGLVLVASGSWFLFEQPILRLKRLFPYGERQQVRLESYLGVSSAG